MYNYKYKVFGDLVDIFGGGNSVLIVNKGSSIGWSYEELEKSKTALGFDLVDVMKAILKSWDDEKSGVEINTKNKGLIKKAYLGMYHDFHGLAIQIDLIEHLFSNRKDSTLHKDFLYVSEVVENYFSNLRSIYDFMASLLRLAVKKRFWGQFNFDSLNSLIEAVSNGKTNGKFSDELNERLLTIKDEFIYVRGRRDSFIHNGEQVSVMTDEEGYHIEVSCESEQKKKIVPLLVYLSDRTNKMFNFGEKIAQIIFDEYCKEYGEVPLFLTALEGVCIPGFIKFLGVLPED